MTSPNTSDPTADAAPGAAPAANGAAGAASDAVSRTPIGEPAADAEAGRLAAGEAAPDAEVISSEGPGVQLASLWAERPLVLVFLPPHATAFCEDNATQLRDAHDTFSEAGGELVAVITRTPAAADALGAQWRLGYRLLCDPDLQVHRAFGLVIAHPMAMEARPGSFVIDTGGTITYAHRGAGPSDYPPTSELIAPVCDLTGVVITPPPPPESVEPAPSLTMGLRAPGAIADGAFACAKCGGTEYEVGQVSTASGMLSRLSNFQHRKFSAVTCTRCSYTELYKTDSSKLGNVFDLLAGG